MIDTHIKSKNPEELKAFCNDFTNKLGPLKGVAESTSLDEEGNTLVTPAKGDPEYWYATIRTNIAYSLPYDGVEQATKEECEDVLGRWFGE